MKTAEDEAFEDIERRQGGGFKAKQAMAADKFKDGIAWWMDTTTYGAYPNPPQWHIDTGKLVRLVPAQPAQEPVAEVVWGAKTDFEWKFKMLVELACVEDVPVKLYAGEFKGASVYWHDTETDKGTTPPKREWVGLTDEEIDQSLLRTNHALQTAGAWREGVEWATEQLKEKNT